MGRKSISGGVMPKGTARIQLDFNIDRKRFRPTLPWVPTNKNLERARARLAQIKMQIAAGTFSFAEEFPDYRYRRRLGIPLRTLSCSDVFDGFLRHGEARVARGDLAPITLTSYRRILNRIWRPRIGRITFLSVRHSTLSNIVDAPDWGKKTYNNVVSTIRRAFEFGYRDHPDQSNPAALLKSARIRRSDRPPIDPFPIAEAEILIAAVHRDWGEAQGNYDEFRFFTGLRPSEEIALLASDFDAVGARLAITKARVAGCDRDITKTGESRAIELCPRALAILQRQLTLREALKHAGQLKHECLFFDSHGAPLRDLRTSYRRWRSTLRRLPIRYRKPYTARHSLISWQLMIGSNPLWVAQQHGHSPFTMLTVYAAWIQGSRRADIAAIRRALRQVPGREVHLPNKLFSERPPGCRSQREPNLAKQQLGCVRAEPQWQQSSR
jgi:integrase